MRTSGYLYTAHVLSLTCATRFNEQDSFVGYQNDTPASVVFQATEQLREEQGGEVNVEMEESVEWLDLVLECSKSLLVQMASFDALIILQHARIAEEERRKVSAMYTRQHRRSIREFLCHHFQQHEIYEDGLLLNVSGQCDHLLITVH